MMELWPFTNFHDLNLDWIVRKIMYWDKKLIEFFDTWDVHLKDIVDEILADHPEWTTTVMDGSITDAKIANSSTMLHKSSYIPEITLTNTEVENNAAAYVTIPNTDAAHPYIGDAGDYVKTPIEYAGENSTTVTANIGITLHDVNDNTFFPTIISDGQVIYEHQVTETLVTDDQEALYIAIPYDRSSITEYPIQTDTATLLAGGYDIVTSAFFPLIRNGTPVDLSGFTDPHVIARKTPRIGFGLRQNGDIVLLAVDGYSDVDIGITGIELQNAMANLNCKWAYAMDGGGSTSLVYHGYRAIRFIDGDGTQERHYRYTLNCKAQNVNKVITASYANTGKVQAMVFDTLMPLVNFSIELTRKLYHTRPGVDLDDVETMIGYIESGTNTPSGVATSGWLVSFNRTWTSGFRFQLYIPYDAWTLDNGWFRIQNSGNWSAWKSIGPVEITNSLITMNSGYELSAGVVWQQGAHIYGDVVIHKTGGNFSNSTETVASLSIHPGDYAVNTGCWFSDSQWYNQNIGYLYYGSGLSVKPEVHDTYSYVKLHIDFVID